MITKQHSHYLKFLAQGHKTLLISSNHYNEYDEVSDYFDLSIQRDLSESELDNITVTLMNNSIDIVVLDFVTDYDLAYRIFEKIQNYELRIITIGIVPYTNKEGILQLIEKLDSVLFEGFNLQQIKDKLFMQLSLFYTIRSISRRDYKINSGSNEMDMSLDEFFDMYEGSSLFIVDELISLNKSLKSGDLSSSLLEEISKKLLDIAETFSKNAHTADLSAVFIDFATYLKELDFTKIKPESLYAFDYICAIIDDTNEYIMDMFVDRVFKDTYIVVHSLENNIEFMKNALSSKDSSNDSELEFF